MSEMKNKNITSYPGLSIFLNSPRDGSALHLTLGNLGWLIAMGADAATPTQLRNPAAVSRRQPVAEGCDSDG